MIYPKFPKERVNFLFDLGGLGDNIARLPAMKYVLDVHKQVDEIIWVPDYFYPLAKNMIPEANWKKFSEGENEYEKDLPGRTTSSRAITNLKIHMTDHGFMTLAHEVPSVEYRNYLKLNTNPISIKKFDLPEKYVVVPVGYTAPIREFLPEYVNKIVEYIRYKGYQVVFLGNRDTRTGIEADNIRGNFSQEIDYKAGIDLINKTSLLEAGKIISKAKCIVGLDNGLLHLAGCTDIPIVYGFTSVKPEHRLPYRHNEMGWNCYVVVPPDSEPEKFCQSIWDFCFEHDFKFSYYKNDSLIRSVTPELYIEQLEKIL